MLKITLLTTALLTTPVTFPASAQTEAAHIGVSAVSGPSSVMEDAIAELAQREDATS